MSGPDPAVAAWLADLSQRLGVDAPTPEEIDAVLALAAVAARGSARQAAPVACWLAARAGVGLEDALEFARSIPPRAAG
ncbi:MAG: DUF6457 domain-containing protein [Acidimicrobiales bacterium]